MNYKECVRKVSWLVWGTIKEFSQTDEENHEKPTSGYHVSGVGIRSHDLLDMKY
jgi:hypothetical protein